jgi:hypothetical protein
MQNTMPMPSWYRPEEAQRPSFWEGFFLATNIAGMLNTLPVDVCGTPDETVFQKVRQEYEQWQGVPL